MVYKDDRIIGFNKPLYIGNNALDIYSRNLYYLITTAYEKNVNDFRQFPINHVGYIQHQFLDLVSHDDLIIQGIPIMFSDDTWDFNKLFVVGKATDIYIYHFNGANTNFGLTDSFIIVLKLYMWHLISSNGIHQSSNRIKFRNARSFLRYLSEKNFMNLRDVTVKDFDNYIQSQKWNYRSVSTALSSLKNFYIFYSQMAENIYTDDFVELFNNRDSVKLKAVTETNKATLLPTLFYRKFTQMIFDFTLNTNNTLRERGMAGLLYIGTQTGLRTSELQILKNNCVEPIYYENNLAHKLKYFCVKTGKHGKHKQGYTIANDRVKEMVAFLQVLFTEFRSDSDYLVPAISKGNTTKGKPPRKVYSANDLIQFMLKFCIINCNELGVLNTEEWNMFDGSYSINKNRGKDTAKIAKMMGLTENDLISYPRIRQFRVYIASELQNKGYGQNEVADVLGHDSDLMWGYYQRNPKEAHENINFEAEIPESVRNPFTNLNTQDTKKLKQKVDVFLEYNTIDVRKGVHDVMDSVNGSVPVTLERGGFCIKDNARRLCPKSMNREELISIFGIADHSAFFFMAQPVYHVYKQLVDTIKYNQNYNFINQAQKEMYRLEAVINDLLLPVTQDLENELILQGRDVLIEGHPDLAYIIDHLEEIEGDIQSWKLKIEELN
nr:hypothetical protein [uncultured Trichococcus sp.]